MLAKTFSSEKAAQALGGVVCALVIVAVIGRILIAVGEENQTLLLLNLGIGLFEISVFTLSFIVILIVFYVIISSIYRACCARREYVLV